MINSQDEILNFWFVETTPKQWFQKSEEFDQLIIDEFSKIYVMALKGYCDSWIKDADGCLALILIFDQFPRNMFRGKPESFLTDDRALSISRHAIKHGFDQVLTPLKRRFLYLPFEHSENLADQERAVKLFESMKEDDPMGYEYAKRHLDVIKKFGRFPHRNEILGRISTADEILYLRENGGF
jgi:uncharacterized protein (DUF924 family)